MNLIFRDIYEDEELGGISDLSVYNFSSGDSLELKMNEGSVSLFSLARKRDEHNSEIRINWEAHSGLSFQKLNYYDDSDQATCKSIEVDTALMQHFKNILSVEGKESLDCKAFETIVSVLERGPLG